MTVLINIAIFVAILAIIAYAQYKVRVERKKAENGQENGQKEAITPKDFGNWNRSQKRHAIILLKNGKKVKAYEYLREVAAKMPAMFTPDKGRKIDHLDNLKVWYGMYGIEGISEYVSIVADRVKEYNEEARTLIKDLTEALNSDYEKAKREAKKNKK